MKVFITGVAGFIGSNLARTLLQNGYHVIGVDNLSAGITENMPSGVEFYQQDIREKGLTELLTDCQVVFHLAAKNTLIDCIRQPQDAVTNNVYGTVNLLEAMREANVKRLIYADTAAEYEGIDIFPSPINMVRPLGIYGVSKRSASLFCESYAHLYGFQLTTCRYFNVYGPSQDWRRSLPPVMSAFAIKLLCGETPIIYGTGEKRRDFIHVDDVNAFHLLALQDEKTIGKVFNLGTGVATSVNEIYQMTAHLLGSNIQPIYEDDLPGEAQVTQADIKEALAVGWKPMISVEQGLAQFLEHIRPQVLAGKARAVATFQR